MVFIMKKDSIIMPWMREEFFFDYGLSFDLELYVYTKKQMVLMPLFARGVT